MTKISFLFTFLLITLTTIMAQNQTPLIDREVFFGNPEISSGDLSPDGAYVSFMKEHNGIMNLWVKALDADFADAKLLTNSESPILGYFWTYDGRYILYVNDQGGDENMNVFAVDPRADAEGEVPPSRNLTPMEEVTAQIYQVSRNNPDKLMIGLNDRDKAWHDLYELTISTGELKLIRENDNRFTGWSFDWDENLRLAYRTDENGHSEILSIDDQGDFNLIYKTNLQESAYVAGWTPDNKNCYLVSNKGDVNLSTLYQMDPNSGRVQKIESDPKNMVDFGGLFLEDNTREIIATSYTYDKQERHWKNEEWKALFEHLESKFPNREIGFTSFTNDYNKMLIAVSGDKYATDVYFYDRQTDQLVLQYTPRPVLKRYESYLSEMKPISYKSSDGMEIPAYLSLPVGVEAKNLPVVMFIHGGPKGPRDYWGYNSRVQLLTNRGYAVLQPNFRASGGYGKAFLNAGDKEWGKKMQDDITWGVKYLVDQGIADPERVAIMGGSYGGYATLAGLAFTPDLYACGIDIVGPSNLFTLLESIPPYWEAGRKWLYEMVGDPDTEEGAKLLREASPLFSADQIDDPLLIVQGANDPRVKKAESDQIVIALRENGHPVEYLLAMDEGHGFRKPLNRKAMWAQSEKFLAQYLGGRYQEDMTDEVAETLSAITVDIESVTYEKPAQLESLSSFPTLQNSLREGTTDYSFTIEVNGQTIPAELQRTVTKENNQWVVKDAGETPMGSSTDIVRYGEDLKLISREINQAGTEISINFQENGATLSMAGSEIPIESEGLLWTEGPGSEVFFSGMDKAAGDQISFYALDMMTGKAKQKVAHWGQVETMDGISAQTIEITALDNENDKTTLWINAEDGSLIKKSQVVPAMGNAVMTMVKK